MLMLLYLLALFPPLRFALPAVPISPDITIEVEDWIDSPVSSTVPVPVVRVKKTKKRRHRPAPVPFVNIVEVPASSVITVNAVVPAGSVPASVEGEVKVLPGIDAPAFISNAHSIDSPVHQVPPDIARCLSPGPPSDCADRSSLSWPFSECPDWPINREWLDFAFDKVTFKSSVDIDIDTDIVSGADLAQ